GGFTDAELAEIKHLHKAALAEDPEKEREFKDADCPFFYALESAAAGENAVGKKAERFLSLLNGLRRDAGHATVHMLMSQIAARIPPDLLFESQDDEQILYGYIQMVAGLEANARLHDFVKQLDVPAAEAEAPAYASRHKESIRMMTVHASKGLEFPVVILASTDSEFIAPSAAVLTDSRYGLGIKRYDTAAREYRNGIRYTALQLRAAIRERYESLRVLYVALTRARDKLIITGVKDCDKVNPLLNPYALFDSPDWAEWIVKATYNAQCSMLNEGTRHGVRGIGNGRDDGNLSSVICHLSSDLVPDGELVKLIQAAAFAPVPAPPQCRKTTVTAVNQALTEDGGAEYAADGLLSDNERALDIGNAYHAVMEHIDIGATDPAAGIAALVRDGKLSAEAAALVSAEKIGIALRSGLFGCPGQSSKIYREKEFLFYIPYNEVFGYGTADKVLVQGIIDILFVKDGECVIADYKTTRGTEETLKKQYAAQLSLYAAACRQILGLKVTKRLIYSFYLDKIIELTDDR
ncbi:MAG: PD-(D/E)XK nuclease family protein, partial [Firmicutes bacterium]|nr:PD-(D/E)XK nuclease family protein [Bacillota bacterium]